jgi:hypothetical protein
VRIVRLLLGLAALFAPVLAHAQVPNDAKVEIRNTSGEARRVCFYKGHADINLAPDGCVMVDPGETKSYDRAAAGDRGAYKVKVFKPALFDQYLYARKLPADAGRLLLRERGRFSFVRYRNIAPPPDQGPRQISLCNANQPRSVWVVIALRHAGRLTANGYWEVKPGTCINVPFHRYSNAPQTVFPEVFYWARTYGDAPLYWSGKPGDVAICKQRGEFRNEWRPLAGADLVEGAECAGEGSEIVYTRRHTAGTPQGRTTRLTF